MDRLFGLDSVSAHDEGLEHVATAYSSAELAIIGSILDDASIPYLVKDRGAGSSVKIIAGFSMYGSDIFVPAQAADTAKALLMPAEDGCESEDGEDD